MHGLPTSYVMIPTNYFQVQMLVLWIATLGLFAPPQVRPIYQKSFKKKEIDITRTH